MLRYLWLDVSKRKMGASTIGFARPVLEPRSASAAMRKPAAFVVLGMVGLGARSGYAVKKAADVSTQTFWPISLAQVYPQLAELARDGLATREDDPHGARPRAAYRLTPAGVAALKEWLTSTREPSVQLRDEGVLRLFFADELTLEEQAALVRRLSERADRIASTLRETTLPLAAAQTRAGKRFPELAARFGIEVQEHAAVWLAGLGEELEQEARSAAERSQAPLERGVRKSSA